MKGLIQLLLMLVLIIQIGGCSSTPVDDTGEMAETSTAEADAFDLGEEKANDEFAEDSDLDLDEELAQAESKGAESAAAGDDELALDETASQKPAGPQDQQTDDEFFDGDKMDVAEQAAPDANPEVPEDPPPPEIIDQPADQAAIPPDAQAPAEEPPPPEVADQATDLPPPPEEAVPAQTELPPATEVAQEAAPENQLVTISNIKFEANEAGGTVIIEADQPLNYTSRANEESNQFVVEIENAKLPANLKRPYITKDFASSVGAVDAYQDAGSNIARVVIQMKAGASMPNVQAEGNSLLVVTTSGAVAGGEEVAGGATSTEAEVFAEDQGILSSNNLQEFLAGNMKFYGKPISIEAKNLDIREAISIIAEESGANLILSEDVRGEVSIKLRQVPWDQALVMIMKTRKLGYTRNGNVLRIASLNDIREEEESAIRLAESKRKVDPLKVQVIPISFAKVDELRGQVVAFLSERGKVASDNRTSSLIVTDTQEIIDRVKKLVSSLDVAPPQVLIEGKIVEARESFEKRSGIQWSLSGAPINLGEGSRGPVNMQPSLGIRPGISTGNALGLNLSIGTLDVLGDINAVLSLQEREDNVRVISSPRIVTLHNEPAEITQQGEVVFIRSSVQDGVVTRSPEFKPVNLKLQVLPQITNEGSVIMNVDVKRDFVGPAVDEQTQAAPVNSRNAKTKVLVRNGQTAVIGGIYQSDSLNSENGVPGIKDVPIIGWLFRSENERRDKTELLIFLTPRILAQDAAAAAPMNAPEEAIE